MGKGRSVRGDREFSKYQKLVHENRKLKQEVSRLRKLLDRTSHHISGADEEVVENTIEIPKPKKTRLCFKCQEDNLKITKYTKRDGTTWYYRACSCGYRTRGKKWTPEVSD